MSGRGYRERQLDSENIKFSLEKEKEPMRNEDVTNGGNLKMSEPKYIRFVYECTSPSGKTEIWSVLTKDDEPTQIGEIKWNAAWRCYSFFVHPWMFLNPDDFLVYEKTCLRDIADFCEEQTKLQKTKSITHVKILLR